MSNTRFVHRNLIVFGFFIPAGYALIFFPFAILAFAMPAPYSIVNLLAVSAYIAVGILAWRKERLIWTAAFLLLSASPLAAQFIVIPELEKRHFRDYRSIPDDAKILYYKETGFRDTTRFCLIQYPPAKRDWQHTSNYRPFLPGALAIMHNVQRELGIPESKMPNLDKQTLTYTGGEGEVHADGWSFLDVYDSESGRNWIFEDEF